MLLKNLSAAAAVLVAANLVSAQTSTKCDPTRTKCPDNPALGKSLFIDFTKGPHDEIELAEGTQITNYDPVLGAEFVIEKEGQAPTVWMNKYILFGTVSVVCRVAPGTGIVTSVVLQSEDLDEIDWEWIGGKNSEVQSNYFRMGDNGVYDRGATHALANPQGQFYNYTIDWTPEYIRWFIDGGMVRELLYADAKGGTMFPQTPSKLKLGPWVGGSKTAEKGVVDWAGGYTDFSQGPFRAYYKSISISDYHKGAVRYVWPDVPAGGRGDGSWQGIKVIRDGSDGSESSSQRSSQTTSQTSSAPASSTTSTTTPSASSSAASSSDGSHGSDDRTTVVTVTSTKTHSEDATTTPSTTPSNTRGAAASSSTPGSNGASIHAPSWYCAPYIGAGLIAAYFTL